jgi:adenosylmethionine-8-amino-7-oxononanoate aminotransferase
MPSKIHDKVDARPESGVLYARLATKPPTVKSGSGIYLITSDGRKILDNARVKDAVMRQMDDVAYCYAPFFTTAPAEELANWLCASTDWQMSRVFVVSSGE